MASKKPLVNSTGSVQQLQAADSLTVGDWDLPNAISDNGKVIITVGGAAAWDYSNHTELVGVTADQHHNEAHTVNSHSDTTATGAELETLTDGSNADALHVHAGAGTHNIASHNDTTATGTELETLTDGSNADSLHAHTYAAAPSGNTTFYVATTGNDTTGTGVVGFPYLTLDRALTAVYDVEFEYHAVATIELDDGIYSSREILIQSTAPSLVIQGNSVYHYTFSELTAVSTSGDIYDLTFTVNTTVGMVAGYLLGMKTRAGKRYINGAWEILSVISGTSVEVRVHSHVVTPTTGAIAGTAVFCGSMIKPIDSVTIEIKSDNVTLTGLSFFGLGENTGISIEGCGNVVLGPDILVNDYLIDGIYARGAHITCTEAYVSWCNIGLDLYGSSTAICYDSVFGGHDAYGLRCLASDAVCDLCLFTGNAQIGLFAARFSKVQATNSYIWGNVTGVGTFYESYAEMYDGNTFASNTTDRSPNSGEGNFNSYMRN